VAFYSELFRLEATAVGDSDEFRYTTLGTRGTEAPLVGIMDARSFLPENAAAHWITYWDVINVDESVAAALSLGGAVILALEDTPYGRLATLADDVGAQFRLRQGDE
jgi:hypothetical protein